MTLRSLIVKVPNLVASELIALACSSTLCRSEENDPTVKFYLSLEKDARKLYDAFGPAAAEERERKRRAGQPALSSEEEEKVTYAARELIYNKTLFYPLCAEEKYGASGGSFEKLSKDLLACVNRKQDELFEMGQLEKYVTIIGDRKYIACEVKARDFKSERRFPPFDFLRDPRGVKAIDYGKFNECIKAQL